MEAVLILPLSPTFKFSYSPRALDASADISGKLANNLRKKLNIHFRVNLKTKVVNLRNEEAVLEEEMVDHGDKKNKTEAKEEEEFSFDCTNSNISMVSAEDVFVNGMICPMFPINADVSDGGLSLRPPLKKLFIQRPGNSHSSLVATKSEELNGASGDPYSKWLGKLAVDASPEKCKMGNSTGFSKLWRFREIFHRSKSDGKDTSVFMNPPTIGGFKKEAKKKGNTKTEKKTRSDKTKNSEIKVNARNGGTKVKTTSSANEKYYLINRAKKENDKRRSYLPYKLGFFTNVNDMNKNIDYFK